MNECKVSNEISDIFDWKVNSADENFTLTAKNLLFFNDRDDYDFYELRK